VPGGTGSANTCVLYVDVPVGTTALRVYGDKSEFSLNPFAKQTKLFAGWTLQSQPKAVASGSVTGSTTKGDVMLTLDVSGKPGTWWILVESENQADVWVSAVAYDIGQRPRVSVELGRRTGVIAVENGAAQIFRVQLPANKDTILKINIDAGWIGTIGQNYDVFANILDDKKIEMITNNLSITSLFDFLAKVAQAFKDGKVDALFPKFLTPGPMNFDVMRTGHFINFGKVEFPVASSKQAPIVYVAIKPQTNLPWSGDLSSFTVQFSTTEKQADNTFDSATCEKPSSRRRDVEQTTPDACASKVCADCVADASCNYCYGASVTQQACRAKSAGACPANSAPATASQCRECVSAGESSTTCGAVANCKWCSALSAGDPVAGCTQKWTCPDQATSPPTQAPGTAADPVASTTGGSTGTAKDNKPTTDAATVALSLGVALVAMIAPQF
jgi:hypothetical protein